MIESVVAIARGHWPQMPKAVTRGRLQWAVPGPQLAPDSPPFSPLCGLLPIVKQDQDLFHDTTMTFGEHLEDLRTALFKALLGLILGSLLGFAVGDRVVHLMAAPLTKALGAYYVTDAEERYTRFISEQETLGSPVPTAQREETRSLLHTGRWIFDVIYKLPENLPKDIKLPPEASASQQAEFAEALEKQLGPQISLRPLQDDSRVRIKAFNAPEAFSIWLKASLVVGVIISSPWVFYHIWAFVAAGLYPHEKRYVHIFLPFSLGLFLLGAATAYIFVFGPVLQFLFGFNRWLGLDPDPRITEWLSFVLLLPLGFGISFQLPLVMLFLERIGVFSVAAYLSKWRLAVLIIFILSAVLTPADPYSLLLMACPLTLLYFFGLLLCKYLPRRQTLD
jgi:sec-independent protein translocase protein TatC